MCSPAYRAALCAAAPPTSPRRNHMTTIHSISLASQDPAAGELFLKNAFGLGAGVGTHAHDEASSGFRGFTLSVLVPGPSDVRALVERALAAGASAIKEPVKSLWGFGAVLTAPDGTIWKIASRKKKDSGAPTGRVEDRSEERRVGKEGRS